MNTKLQDMRVASEVKQLLRARFAFSTSFAHVALAACIATLALCGPTAAQTSTSPAETQKWREIQVGPKPDWSWLTQLRFVTETDYPPFHYYDEDGQLAGFNVDLARAICRELNVPCEVSTADWSSLVSSLKNNETDAVIASLSITPKSLNEVDFTNRYYTTPARFVGKLGDGITDMSPYGLKYKTIAVTKGTAHEAFLKDFFKATIKSYDTDKEAREALKKGDVDLLFGDGISLMFWVQGSDANRCCEFKGEGYFEARYFGEGIGIAIKKGNARMREVLDYALARVRASGRYEELMLRYFPLPLY